MMIPSLPSNRGDGCKRTKKGDFAQELASRVEKGAPFTVPDYLRDAINAIAQA